MTTNDSPQMIATRKMLHKELIEKLCEERMDRLMADAVEAAIVAYDVAIALAEAAVVHLADEDDDNAANSETVAGTRKQCDRILRGVPPSSRHDAVSGSRISNNTYFMAVPLGMGSA